MKYLSIFKDLFGTVVCPVHHKEPIIFKDDEDELQVTCCCSKFKKECLFLIHKIAGELAKEGQSKQKLEQ